MTTHSRTEIRDFIKTLLESRGQSADFRDDEDLILNNRLDSMAVIELVIYLETHFKAGLTSEKIDAEFLGTPNKIFRLLEDSKAPKA